MATKFEVLLQATLDKAKSDAQLRKDIKEIEKGLAIDLNLKADSKSANQIKNAISGVGNAAKNSKDHVQGLGDIVDKFSRWQIVGDVIHGVKNAMSDMVEQVFELDASLTELDKVTDLSSGGLQKLADDAFNVGERIGATGKDVIDATTLFAQAGYDAKDALDLGEQAIMLQNVSEAGASASDSASTLIATLKAFNMDASQSSHVVDALNAVSNKYAVSVSDLSKAISKSSASMAAGNNTLEQTFGLVTAGTEILREPGRVANGLSTITARLTAKNDDYIASITGGMGVIDENTGELRSTFEILQDLSKAWENLSSVEKQELTETVAGKTQRALFTALMTNFESAVGATEVALNSEGSAMDENAKRMDSLEGKTRQLQSAWQDFARNTIDSTVIKSIISLGTSLIKFANTDIGRLILGVTTAVVALKGLNKAFVALKATKTISGIINLFYKNLLLTSAAATASGVSVSGFTMATAAATLTVKSLTAALLSNPLFWGIAIVAGIFAIVKAVDAATVSFEEQQEKVNNLKQEYEDIKQKVSETTTELEKISKRIDELNKKDTLSIVEEKELEDLKRENKLLETQLKILQETEKIKKKEKAQAILELATKFDDTPKETRKARSEGQHIGKIDKPLFFGVEKNSKVGLYEENRDAIEKLNAEIDRLKQNQTTLDTSTKKGTEEFNKSQKSIDKYTGYVKQLKDENVELANGFTDWINDLEGGGEEAEKLRDKLISYQEVALEGDKIQEEENKKAADAEYIKLANLETIEALTHAKGELTLAEKSNIENEFMGIDLENQLIDTNSEYAQVLEAVKGNLDLLNTAYEEQAANGSLSLDTVLNLINANADYINYLEIENGQVRLSEQAYIDLSNAKIDQAKANIMIGAAEVINRLSGENVEVLSLADSYNALAKAKANASESGDVEKLEQVEKQIKLLDQFYADNKNKRGGLVTRGYTPQHYTPKKSTGGASSKKEEYKAEIDILYKYKNALDEAKDAVDTLNDKLKDTDNFNEREKYLKQLIKATQKQIKATQDLKNAQSKQINDYIKQLKKQGFQISYNSKTNQLQIKNMERLGKFTGDTAKELEKMIDKIQSLNDNNRNLDSSIRDLNSDIGDFNDQLKDLPEEKLEKFNELMEKFQQSRLDQIQGQIEDLQHEMENDPRLKALEEQIEALEKQNDELDNQKELEEKLLAVEEAKIKLQNAQKQKNIQVYREGQGFVWEADPDAIKDAAKELEDAQNDLNETVKQNQIDQLEAEKEALEKSYQDRIDALEKFLKDQNYLIDKANRDGIETFDELKNALAEFGLDSAANLKTVTDWLNNYNKALSNLNTNVNGILSSASKATDGLIYSSEMQDKINSALSSILPNIDTNTGLTLSNVKTETIDKDKSNSIYINSIELPNVKDIDDFVEALKDLPRLASSQSTLRK